MTRCGKIGKHIKTYRCEHNCPCFVAARNSPIESNKAAHTSCQCEGWHVVHSYPDMLGCDLLTKDKGRRCMLITSSIRTNSDSYATRDVGVPRFLCRPNSEQRDCCKKNCRANSPLAGHCGKTLARHEACRKDPHIACGYLEKIGRNLVRPGVGNCQLSSAKQGRTQYEVRWLWGGLTMCRACTRKH